LKVEKTGEPVKPGFKIKSFDSGQISPKFSVTFYMLDGEDKIILSLVYKSNIVEQYRVKRIMYNLSHLVEVVFENEDIKIQDIELAYEAAPDSFELEMEEYFDDDDFIDLR
jgi:hypothetical protein